MAASPEKAEDKRKLEEIEKAITQQLQTIGEDLEAVQNQSGAIERQLAVANSLKVMHQNALSYAGRKPKGIARELNEMFLASLPNETKRLHVLKTYQARLADLIGRYRKNLEILQGEAYQNFSVEKKRQLQKLEGLCEQEKLKEALEHNKNLAGLPPAAGPSFLTVFAEALSAKSKKDKKSSAKWINETRVYFNSLLLQPEIFDVDIQEQLDPVVTSLAQEEVLLQETLEQLKSIQNITNEASQVNKKIKEELNTHLRTLDENKSRHLETKLNRLYGLCCPHGVDGPVYYGELNVDAKLNLKNELVQRYMFILLCQRISKKYPEQKDEVNRWIRQKTEERALLRSVAPPPIGSQEGVVGEGSGSQQVIVVGDSGTRFELELHWSVKRDEGMHTEGKESDYDASRDNDGDFEVVGSNAEGQFPSPKIERRPERERQGSSPVPQDGAKNGQDSVDNASFTLSTYSGLLKLTTEQKALAGMQVGLGLVLILGGFVLAAGGFVGFIPSLTSSVAIGTAAGCAVGAVGVVLLGSGLAKFGLFGEAAQKRALQSSDWRIDPSSLLRM